MKEGKIERMATNRRKATNFQSWIQKWLEAEGWLVHNEEIGGRFKVQRDIFGCIDLIAKKGCYTLWIQAKASSRPALKPVKEKFDKVPWAESDMPMLWVKRANNKVDIFAYKESGFFLIAKIINNKLKINLKDRRCEWLKK